MEMEYILLVAGAMLTSIFALIRWSLSQFEVRLNEKFSAANVRLNEKFEKVDSLIIDVKRLEFESLKRHADYIALFVQRTEYLEAQRQSNSVVNRIFKLLQGLSETMNGKVDKGNHS